MDGAGPHVEKQFTTTLENEFNERGWMLVAQPPNSPICNVKDALLFPSLSKAVSSIQSTIYNNKILEGDEINACVQQAWQQMPKTTISRAYLHHHQTVSAIVPGGLHCGVRCHSLPLFDEEGTSAIGIYVAEEPMGLDVDEQLEENANQSTWKYPIPNVSDVDIITNLNRGELRFFYDSLSRQSQLWIGINMHLNAEG